jgi:hypothetical protein
VAEFLLVLVTVIATSLGAFHLGRLTQRDRIEFLLDELEGEVDLNRRFMGAVDGNHPSRPGRMHRDRLRVVEGEPS